MLNSELSFSQKLRLKLIAWVWNCAYPLLAPLVTLALVVLFEQLDLATRAEHLTLNVRYQLRAPFDPPSDPRLLFIGIDQQTLDHFGAWPWPHNVEANFLADMATSGLNPRVIAFDTLFSQDNDLFHNLKAVGTVSFDEELAQAVGNLPCVVTGATTAPEDEKRSYAEDEAKLKEMLADNNQTVPFRHIEGNISILPGSNLAKLPIAKLRENSFFGFTELGLPASDGIHYRVPLLFRLQDQVYPALSLQILCQMLSVDPGRVKIVLGDRIELKTSSKKIWAIPIDEQGYYNLNYRSQESFRGLSFLGLFSALHALNTGKPLPPAYYISKKVLLIGHSSTGLTVEVPSPYAGLSPLPLLNLQVINNVLKHDYLIPVPLKWLVLGWLLVTWALLFYLRKASLVLCIVVPVLMTLLYTIAAFSLFGLWSVQLALFWPVVSFTGVNFGAVVLRWSEEVKGRKEMRQLFSSVTSPRVLHLLEEHPEAFFSHRKVTATMMFSDVAGFTSVSEKLDPPYLASLMNRYLSPMSEIIIRHDGYVNLYMGDGIMALWSALLPDPDHEYKACLAALEQGRVARELTETLPDGRSWNFNIRIGINTGLVSAGNLGSNQKKQYTVMGDEVNLTARLEPTNKDYGTQIIIGPRTYAAVRTRLWTRGLDKIIVTGRSEGVLIYELIGQMEDESLNPGLWPAAYESGLQALWQRQWDEADTLFAQCDQLRSGGDPAARLQRRRIQDYRVNPPPDGWQGDYARLKKD